VSKETVDYPDKIKGKMGSSRIRKRTDLSVKKFIEGYKLAPLSVREGSKYLG
jgi:hypothetical protein